MHILISGASGLVGTASIAYLRQRGYNVSVLSRVDDESLYYWRPEALTIKLAKHPAIDAVINLNGANIGEKRWSARRKSELVSSRVDTTRFLCDALSKLAQPPKVFLNASAIGFYGDTGDSIVTEEAASGDNFLADLCVKKESACKALGDLGVRIVQLRTSLVLARHGGALKSMLLPFQLGLGGVIGSGRQLMSWITLLDECRAIEFLIKETSLSGAFNIASPNVVSNVQWTKSLGGALKRPTFIPMPQWWVKTLFGEMGELLLLGSVGVQPKRLLEAGFNFRHEKLDHALDHVLHFSQ